MPNLNLITRYKFATDLIISPSTLVSEYLHGIPLTDQNGKNYPLSEIRKKILDAQTKLENFLEISFVERETTDKLDYNLTEWLNWGHLKLLKKCNELISVKGIALNRQLMGATNPKDAEPGTIRGDLAESVEANAVHGSDSAESAAREIAYFFTSDEICTRS